MPHGKTKFQRHWLTSTDANGNSLSSWCKEIQHDPFKAMCIICNKAVSCDNSGKNQLLKHATGDKHKELAKTKLDANQKTFSFAKPSSSDKPGTSSTSVGSVSPGSEGAEGTSMTFLGPSLNEQIKKAEILWLMKLCYQDWSFASCDGIGDLFSVMFPGSVSSAFQMGPSKVSYLVADGIGPYFQEQVASEISKVHVITLS